MPGGMEWTGGADPFKGLWFLRIRNFDVFRMTPVLR